MDQQGGFRAATPRSHREIEEQADWVRSVLGLGTSSINMAQFIENVLAAAVEGYIFEVLPDEEMDGYDGISAINEYRICLNESTEKRLRAGHPAARMVAAHEFGHLMLHAKQVLALAKRTITDQRFDPEWQADRFADCFLMPRDGVLRCRSANHVAAKYGVPDEDALRRFIEVHGEIQGELF